MEEALEFDSTVFTTSVAEQAQDAIFDEVFQFDLQITKLSQITLVIELWDFSELIEPGELLGSVDLPAQDLAGRSFTQWCPIKPKVFDKYSFFNKNCWKLF